MPDTDIISAVRNVATRYAAARKAGHTDIALRMSEVAALLPALDAVAARADADRMERLWDVVAAYADMPSGTWTQGGCVELHGTLQRLIEARAAIVLADADRAARD